MALTYKIKTFETEAGDSSKTRVGFKVTDDGDNQDFFIDKLVTTGSKSDNAISKEAYDAAQTEVTAWVNGKNNVGKTFNPSSNALED